MIIKYYFIIIYKCYIFWQCRKLQINFNFFIPIFCLIFNKNVIKKFTDKLLNKYKNSNCISELNLNIPELNFGECYKKIKFIDNIEEDLIIGIITKNIEGKSYPKIIYYSIYEPKEGQKISLNQICNNLSLEIKEDILIKLDTKKKDINSIKHLAKQNIDIFNLSCSFY